MYIVSYKSSPIRFVLKIIHEIDNVSTNFQESKHPRYI